MLLQTANEISSKVFKEDFITLDILIMMSYSESCGLSKFFIKKNVGGKTKKVEQTHTHEHLVNVESSASSAIT